MLLPPIPEEFWTCFQEDFPEEDFPSFQKALHEEKSTTAIRLNRQKILQYNDLTPKVETWLAKYTDQQVPWHPFAYRLFHGERIVFASDPFWQTGFCYIQEPSSMAVGLVAEFLPHRPLRVLDLCAAPGGKSTLLMDLLPAGSLFVCNEPIPKRASILRENLLRWGYPKAFVTQAFPSELLACRLRYDFILVDAPCSGEGMFRKSEAARTDWSPAAVRLSAERQREILDAAWHLLSPGGLLVYSTCTFNCKENEENASYILQKPEACVLSSSSAPSWGFVPGKNGVGYHAFPHRVTGEGLYFAFFKKQGEEYSKESPGKNTKKGGKREKIFQTLPKEVHEWLDLDEQQSERYKALENTEGEVYAFSPDMQEVYEALREAGISIRLAGIPLGQRKAKNLKPHAFLPYSALFARNAFPKVKVDRLAATRYFSGEALQGNPLEKLSGPVLVTYEGIPLGFANATEGRLNNLFPKLFRLRKVFS